MKKPLRIAILGCGRMGKQHAATCHEQGATVRLLCDPDRERARALSQVYPHATVSADAEAIDWSEIDAGFFCTPPFARGPAERAAAAAGVALFMEKPVGLSHEEGGKILDAVRRAKGLTAVGYMNRYRNSVRHARQMARELGILGMACHWVGSMYRVPWWGRRELSGGQINEQCTHYFDLVRYFCGEILEVAAMAQPGPSAGTEDVDVASAVICRAQNGSLATLYASCAAESKQIGVQIFTTSRQISLDGWNLELRQPDVSPEQSDIFAVEVAAFLQAVRTGDRSLILSDLEDALQTQRVVDTVVRAMTSRQWEPVPASTTPPAISS